MFDPLVRADKDAGAHTCGPQGETIGQVQAEHQGADGLSGATLLLLQLRLGRPTASAHVRGKKQKKERKKQPRQVCQGLLTRRQLPDERERMKE